MTNKAPATLAAALAAFRVVALKEAEGKAAAAAAQKGARTASDSLAAAIVGASHVAAALAAKKKKRPLSGKVLKAAAAAATLTIADAKVQAELTEIAAAIATRRKLMDKKTQEPNLAKAMNGSALHSALKRVGLTLSRPAGASVFSVTVPTPRASVSLADALAALLEEHGSKAMEKEIAAMGFFGNAAALAAAAA